MKGLLKSFEAILAVLMILTVFIIFFLTGQEFPEFETVIWRNRGFVALRGLDFSNELRDLVVANDTDTLEDKLSDLLPAGLNYETVICDLTCGQPDITADTLTTVTYLMVGREDLFQPRQVLLYMW